MAYLGQPPFQEFTSVPTKDSFTGDGSTTTFDLANDVVRGAENALEVFVNNVRQEPGSGKAFTLGVDGSNNYRRITFTAAPASSAAIYVINDKTNLTAIAPLNTDFNGAELVLDADADTTLHADTDDEIDVRVAGNDIITIKQSSGDGILQIPVDAKDLIFQQADGNKLFEINDGNFVGVGGNATAPGEIRIFEDTDNGTNYSGFKAAANTTASVAYQLPAADGTSGFQLTTDGSGVLSWASAGTTLANDANNRVVTGTGSGLNGEANLTFDGSTLAVTGAITGSSDLTLQDDLILDSDAAVLSFGEDNEIALTHVADTGLLLTDSGGTPTLQFHDANESISSDGTDLILAAGADINLTATTDINIPANVGLTFGNDAEKIEGDGTDLTIAGNNINLTAVADVVVPANVGVLFGSGEKIEGDNTDLTITSGAKINLTATSDVVVPANVGITFGTGEKIEGDNTDLTVTSGAKINLTATSDVHLPNNVGMIFGDSAEKIEGDGTDLTISGNNIKLTAATDVIIPTNVGLHFTDANEKIESDGSNIKITSGGTEFTIPASDGSNGQALVTNGSGVLSFAAAGSSNPSSADGQALGSASLEWSDLFLADASTIQFGNDQDVTLTHVADTGLLLNTASVIQFRDSAINIGSPADGDLDINADDEIELNSTLIDINGNVEISGTATTTGVHTFTAVPVFPNNTIETADIQADAITNAKIADNALDSEHYTDGSIDAAHIANGAIARLKLSSGMIPQVVNREVYESSQLTSAGSFHELTTDLRLEITPTFSNSVLYLEFFAQFTSPNSSNLAYAKFYDVTNSAEVNLPSAGGSREVGHWAKRTSPVDANDMDMLYMTASVTSGSTNARTYTIYHRTEGATHQFYQSSLSNGSGFSSKMHFRITEVVD